MLTSSGLSLLLTEAFQRAGAGFVKLLVHLKNLPANAEDIRDLGLIPGLGRSLGGENGNLFQYLCLENPVDRGAWQATIHGVTELDTTEVT